MRLNEIQARFKDLMLDHPDVVANPPEDFAAVFASGDIALGERLSVYRNNIVGSLTDVMVASFPVIEALVGKAFLEGMARSFVLAHPPQHGCLGFYGQGFGDFIAGFAPAASLPYLPDIARVEIAMNDAYYARDDIALGMDILAAIPPDELGDVVLSPRDSVRVLRSDYPVLEIRDFALLDQSSDHHRDAPDIDAGGAWFMVYRPALETEIVPLDAGEFALLGCFQDGMALGVAVETVMAAHEGFDFQAFLQKFMALETFLEFEPNRV